MSTQLRRIVNTGRPSVALSRLRGPAPSGIASQIRTVDSSELSIKTTLAAKVNGLLDEQGLSQMLAAQKLGMPQSKVSAIRNYKLHGISLERLMQALVALNQRVEITVKPAKPFPVRSTSRRSCK